MRALVVFSLMLFAAGCRPATSVEDAGCTSTVDIPHAVTDTSVLLGEWSWDHANNRAWTHPCERVSRVEGREWLSITFREDGTYEQRSGTASVEYGTYSFEPASEGRFRLMLDGTSIPHVRLSPEWLVLDYSPVDGMENVYYRVYTVQTEN